MTWAYLLTNMNWRVLNLASIHITLDFEILNWMVEITKKYSKNLYTYTYFDWRTFLAKGIKRPFFPCEKVMRILIYHIEIKDWSIKDYVKLKMKCTYWNHTCESLMRSLTGLWHAVSNSILGWKLNAESHLFFHPFSVFFFVPYFFLHFNITHIYLIKIAVALWQKCNSVLISIHLVIQAFLKLEPLLITIIIIRLTKWIVRMEKKQQKKRKKKKK